MKVSCAVIARRFFIRPSEWRGKDKSESTSPKTSQMRNLYHCVVRQAPFNMVADIRVSMREKSSRFRDGKENLNKQCINRFGLITKTYRGFLHIDIFCKVIPDRNSSGF